MMEALAPVGGPQTNDRLHLTHLQIKFGYLSIINFVQGFISIPWPLRSIFYDILFIFDKFNKMDMSLDMRIESLPYQLLGELNVLPFCTH